MGAARPGRGVKFRRAPHLVSYWTTDGQILENYATRRCAPVTPIVHEILGAFSRWQHVDAAANMIASAVPAVVRRLVGTLVDLTFLQRSDRPISEAEQALKGWRPWGPAAGFFHAATRDTPYTGDLDAVARRMRAKARHEPMPPAVKRYPRARTIVLPTVRTAGGSFEEIVLNRRTWRRFGARPATLGDLADVLGLTFGVQRWVNLPGIGRVALKSSPSGGARHPIECYVAALNVRGLPRGLYHYRPDTHRLEHLPGPINTRDIPRFLPGQPWYAGASVVVLMTAVFARTQWRYASGRAYRVILAEAGHLGQTCCLTASARGLAPFCTMALADTQIEQRLGVDGVSEAVMYAAGFGTRPQGSTWEPWPDGRAAQKRGRGSSRARRALAST